MLTRIRIRNFKRFDDVESDLGSAVVLIGPNDSGKTTALQAIALWDIGLRRWLEKRGGKAAPEKWAGVTVNRRDLMSSPVPDIKLLWHERHIREVEQAVKDGKLSPKTRNIKVEIVVDGVTQDKAWSCGLEFDYANEESLYCRPLRIGEGPGRMKVPDEVKGLRVAFLPPMSGLADREFVKQPGEVSVLIGQGQTAQILRNLCYQIHQDKERNHWPDVVTHLDGLFGIQLLEPQYIAERSEITMAYQHRGNRLDLSSAGRGCQQTLLLLAHLYSNPGAILLLDEPDAHLEILRQRQTYNLLIRVAEQLGSQVIAASHSEVVLNEAAGRDVVVAFVGKPHRMDDRGSQVLKSLRDIGFDQYLQAEETGWVLYLENSSDLAFLQAFAEALDHEARVFLERPFVKYVETNLPQRARDHFRGLREAKPDLVGVALFDRLEAPLQTTSDLVETMWSRREIENYLCSDEALIAYARHANRAYRAKYLSSDEALIASARHDLPEDLFGAAGKAHREQAMREAISEVTLALETLGKPGPWSPDVKATDECLDVVFRKYFEKLDLPLQLRKSDYHILARLVPGDRLDPEIVEKLDIIASVAKKARPRTE